MRPNDDWLTIITVSFNSETVLPCMLASVPEGVKVVIVDNASTGIAAIRQTAANHDAELVELSGNLGFGVACNIGASKAETEFLLFHNPGVEIRPQALETLRTAAERYPAASAFNPRILDESGATSLKRRSNLLPRAEWLPRGKVDTDCEVPVLAGSAIFVRKTDFDAVGGFDALIFLYCEDDDLSLRLRRERGLLFFCRGDAYRRRLLRQVSGGCADQGLSSGTLPRLLLNQTQHTPRQNKGVHQKPSSARCPSGSVFKTQARKRLGAAGSDFQNVIVAYFTERDERGNLSCSFAGSV